MNAVFSNQSITEEVITVSISSKKAGLLPARQEGGRPAPKSRGSLCSELVYLIHIKKGEETCVSRS
jgi:hypothetical protein